MIIAVACDTYILIYTANEISMVNSNGYLKPDGKYDLWNCTVRRIMYSDVFIHIMGLTFGEM